ncbi:MAG TPA: hypothetical protein VFS20_23465, partial [Longimicrobium sp.]|nr:hypothetical protein [Longimicrobium sp.]
MRSRRVVAAWLLFIAAAIVGACENAASPTLDTRTPVLAGGTTSGDSTPGDTTHVPGDTTHVPGDTTGVPGDTTHVPGDTTHVPGDTTHVPGDTTGVPDDTTGVPGDTTGVPGDTTSGPELAHFTVEVWIQADTSIIGVSGAVVTVSRGASNHVVAQGTTGAAGTVSFHVPPGEYTVRLASLPPG